MAKINTDVNKYNIQFQLYILSQIFSNPDIYTRCKNILKPDYFDKDFHDSISYVHDYAQKYNAAPPLIEIKNVGGYDYDDIKVGEIHTQSVLDKVGEYCRHKALALAVEKGMDLVHQKKYGGIEELIREAMLVSIQNELGLDIYEDPANVINSLKNMQGSFSSGWDTLDYKLFGGFGRQELEIFAAQSGGGKSVVLQNLAVNFSKLGRAGAYISLELAEELVTVRLYSMMIDTPITRVKNDVSDTELRIMMEKKSNAMLRVHRLPESVTTTGDIESYVRELQIKTGIKLDYICVDYLDLLTSERVAPGDNTFTKDKYVSEELRALAMKMDLTVFTASQFNRSGIQEETKNNKSQSQIAGGISKIYTADNVIFIDTRKDLGEMWFDFVKTRNSSAVGSRLRMSYNMDSLRILDHSITVQQFTMDSGGGFQQKSIFPVGGANVLQAPSPVQMLHSTLASRTQTSITTEDKSEEVNTKTESTPSTGNVVGSNAAIASMKKFLNNRK